MPGERSTVATLGTDAARKYNVALSRARDRMVLFHSIRPEHVSNPDDLRLWTLQFFERANRPGGTKPGALAAAVAAAAAAAAAPLSSSAALPPPPPLPRPAGRSALGRAALSPEAQLHEWLGSRGYRFSTDCALGGAVAVAEDALEDERLCVCLDGGMGTTLAEWAAAAAATHTRARAARAPPRPPRAPARARTA